jgi:hypothetical protein
MKVLLGLFLVATANYNCGCSAFGISNNANAFRASSSTTSAVLFSSATVEPTTTTTTSTATRTTKAPVFDEVCETTGVTLKRFMTEVTMLNPELQELTTLFGAIDTACKAIANLVKRSQLPSSSTLGYEGAVNVQGEDQKVRNFRFELLLAQYHNHHYDIHTPC